MEASIMSVCIMRNIAQVIQENTTDVEGGVPHALAFSPCISMTAQRFPRAFHALPDREF